MTRPAAGSHAIVLGASLTGLTMARVMADHFDRVTLVERDVLPGEPAWRRGVPQARHTHNLLGAGQQALETLFPGLLGQLRAAGMVSVRMPADMLLLVPGGWVRRFDGPHVVLSGTRDLLDHHVRGRLREQANVTWLENTEATGLLSGGPGGSPGGGVDGVTVHTRTEEGAWDADRELRADLVVDATGRTSQTPAWLRDLGYDKPAESVVDPLTSYATCVFEPPADLERDWKCILIQSTEREPRQGILNPIEGGRWMVSVTGMNGERPPLTHEGFLDFAKRLRTPVLYEAIRDATPVTPVYGSGRTENRFRHYEKLRRWPDRFVVAGDAFGSFNPSYGQGISVAARTALAVGKALTTARAGNGGRVPAGLAARLRKPIATELKAAWALSAAADSGYPWAREGNQSLPARLAGGYMQRLLRIATDNEQAATALFDMTHLVAPPTVVFKPSIVAAVIRAPRQTYVDTTTPPAARGLISEGRRP
jgi:2-polyprenyl-6-methoxyphenol hydroxylase-like FAD-dependent oxidoreductase